jgi:hypothetical protein
MAIWVAIQPGCTETRILATHRAQQTLLKARLSVRPAHPRAIPALLEALALWEGESVRAALCVDGSVDGHARQLVRDLYPLDEPTPLYQLDVVDVRRRKRREAIEGMGDFRDLRQLLLFEVAQ